MDYLFALGISYQEKFLDFLGGPVDKNLPANAADIGQSLVQEDSTG